MFTRLVKSVKTWERRISWSFGDDISTPAKRREALRHFHLVDHAFVRTFWHNSAQIAPGVWRANQPSPQRVKHYADMGIRSIITLRGPARWSWMLFEEEACAAHGITLHVQQLSARKLVSAEKLLGLLDLFERVEKPVLMHCKSGADRAGLASALWLLHMEGASLDRARKELSLRYLHNKRRRAGVLDFMLDTYGETGKGMPIRTWIETRYDPEALMQGWSDKLAGRTGGR